MTRAERIRTAINAVSSIGGPEDTGEREARHEPERFLLVEKNLGRAAYMQSHFFTTHATLDMAWDYHQGQEYTEDWEVVRVVDLDTGTNYVPGATTVEWHEEVVTNGNDR